MPWQLKTNIPGAWVTSNEVTKLSQNVASNFHHVLMTGRGLQGLEETVIQTYCFPNYNSAEDIFTLPSFPNKFNV